MRLTQIVLAALVFVAGSASAQDRMCPAGTVRALDAYGNKVCKDAGGDVVAVEAPEGRKCPRGAISTLDSFGNKVCRTPAIAGQPSTDLYDTSKGCPIGTHPWTGDFGKPICKPN